jgi:hypothetical protein
MTHRHCFLSVFLGALCLLGSLAPAMAGELDGDYMAQGRTAAGKTYSGKVKIKSYGPSEAIVWQLDGSEGYLGLGIKISEVFGAAYSTDSSYFGIVIYQVSGGVLEGVWTDVNNVKHVGREILKGPSGLNGNYEITTGERPDGITHYSGQVLIKPNGKTFVVVWLSQTSPPKPVAVGSGVLIGNKLVVAFSNQHIPGVVGYKINGEMLDGIWSSGGSKEVGTEKLLRQP